jgi:hypothetical protein
MKNHLQVYRLFALAFFLSLLVFFLYILGLSVGFFNNKVYATLENNNEIEAIVHGFSTGITEESYTLLWNQGNDEWVGYYLGHKASIFDNYRLLKNGNNIEVYRNGLLMGILNTQSKKFDNLENSHAAKDPVSLMKGEDIYDRLKWRWPEHVPTNKEE